MKRTFGTITLAIVLILLFGNQYYSQRPETLFETPAKTTTQSSNTSSHIVPLPEQTNTTPQSSENSRPENTERTTPKTNPASAAIPEPPQKKNKIPEATLYQKALKATVNIICNVNDHESVIATGSIIHPDGYILSNAHVAIDVPKNTSCSIRRGSPAVEFDTARLVFVSNAYDTTAETETSAHNDVALWKLRGTGPYEFWELDHGTRTHLGEQFLTISYPAELLGSETIWKGLGLLYSTTAVNATDAFIIRSTGNLGAQKGSSGGALIDPYTGAIHSMIFAVETKTQTSERQIFSITSEAIRLSIAKEKGKTFEEYLASSPPTLY